MANIVIKEYDNTKFINRVITGLNTVFVPGWSDYGPSNEPVLVTSLREFYTKFGKSIPKTYKVENNKVVAEPIYQDAAKTVLDVSWLMAANLLRLGFPVMFYRIDEDAVAASLTESTMEIEALSKGSYGNQYLVEALVEGDKNKVKVYLGTKSSLLETITYEGTEVEGKYVKVSGTFTTISTARFLSNGTDAPTSSIISQLPTSIASVRDKFLFDVKFITSGGYNLSITDATEDDPASGDNISVASKMKELADDINGTGRGDVLCFVDPPYSTDSSQIDNLMTQYSALDSSYLSISAPWATLNDYITSKQVIMPPSYIVLQSMALSVADGNPVWFAPAGVQRASVPNMVKPAYNITSLMMDKMQNEFTVGKYFINPIMKLNQYGYVIFGQRTSMKIASDNEISALISSNVRITANEIKKAIWNICLSLAFDSNTSTLWNKFRGRMTQVLDSLKNGGISDYEIYMDETLVDTAAVSTLTVPGIIRVIPTRVAEYFNIDLTLELSFNLTENGASITQSVYY